MTTFNEVRQAALRRGVKTVAVAAAADAPVLEAVRDAARGGYARAILVGDGNDIDRIAGRIGLKVDGKWVQVVHQPDVKEAALTAARLVHGGKADILMKGLIASADFLRALTALGIAEMPSLERLLVMADGGLHMYPDLAAKIDILSGTDGVCRALEIGRPRYAAVCAVDVAGLWALCSRGPDIYPIGGGTYAVDGEMMDELMNNPYIEHACNLGAIYHRVAERLGKPADETNCVICHMGGGLSVGAHRAGKSIDVNNCLDGDGPMSANRAGAVPQHRHSGDGL